MKRFLLGTGLLTTAVLLHLNSHAAISSCVYDMPPEEANQVDDGHFCSTLDAEIVITDRRIGHSFKDKLVSPASTITEVEITNRGNSTIADLLRSVPGASINRSGPAGSLTQLRLRGAEANQTLVLIDGVEVSNPNTGEFDFASLRSEDVLKIEVLRGEQSALWGPDAIGGVVNIITRSGLSETSISQDYSSAIEGGSFNTGEIQVSSTIPVGKRAGLSVNGNLFTTDGYDVSGNGGDDDGAQSRGLNIGLNNVHVGEALFSAKFSAQTAISEFDSDTDFDGRLDDIDAESKTDTKIARVTGRFNLAGLTHAVNLSHVSTDQETTGTSFQNDTTGSRTILNWVGSKTWEDHTLTLLAETEEEKFSNFGGPGGGQNQDQSIRTHALAADYRFTNDVITLSASARQDFNDLFDDSLTWRAGAGYKIKSINGRLRGSVGTGVKNPTMTEIFGFFPAFFVGNPNIQPEKSIGYNIGYEQNLFGPSLTLSADYFRSDLENEIMTDFSVFPSTVINLETESRREGVEVEARFNGESISSAFSAHASATFLNAEENGVQELRRPEFLGSATLTWDADPFTLTLSADHTGSQFDTDFANFSRVELDSFTLVGLNASYKMSDVLSLSLRGENLLDEDYQEVVGYTSQGRGLYAGLRADF